MSANRVRISWPALLLVVALATSAQAQVQLRGPSFRPDQAEGDFGVDFARLRELGIAEAVEHSLLAPGLRLIERELGLSLDKLDELHLWIRVLPEERVARRVLMVSGDVSGANWLQGWGKDEVGGREVRTPPYGGDEIAVCADGMLAQGNRALIEPVLLGTHAGGQPGADQLSLLAGRQRPPAYVYADLTAAMRSDGGFGFLVEADYPEDGKPTHLLLRLDAVGDPDDPHLQIEAIVRHASASGCAVTEREGRAFLDGLAQQRGFAAVRRQFAAIGIQTDRDDVRARLDLGRLRNSVGTIAQLLAPWLALRRVEGPAQVQAVPLSIPAPAPADPNKDAGGK